LLEGNPARALSLLKRLGKRYIPNRDDQLYKALALAQQGHWPQANNILKQHNLNRLDVALNCTPYGEVLEEWIVNSVLEIRFKMQQITQPKKKRIPKATPVKTEQESPSITADTAFTTLEERFPELPHIEAAIPIRLHMTVEDVLLPDGATQPAVAAERWFQLRTEFARLNLLQGFDELLCLPQLHGVDTYWFQVETVRKVLKQFRGRVLLADEVGLGKTVEAGMVLKEYMLRGMVERVLVLTPASLVGQWHEEMVTKFDIDFDTSYNRLLRTDPERFWAQPRVIASIATARRKDHFARLKQQHYDMVIVDEAHHLKNRRTNNWKLVDGLHKRFLLLLSATPVQNNLVELYNLLTLLKPGIFKTEKEFRSAYMRSGKPRIPANREQMQDLMRGVMIRNTRSLVDVRLPPRQAVTLQLDPSSEEAACYQKITERLRAAHAQGAGKQRMALQHLLSAAGSSPATAAAAIERFARRRKQQSRWQSLQRRYSAISCGAKEQALLDLLKKNPDEKKMVFVHHRETLARLDGLLSARDIPFARFDGSMSGPEKDAAIERFRERVQVLLCSESGGEGRNVQFCNTLINFDLPWNPMLIEQRIGRIHRIGQPREVFIFNLAVRGTIEEQILRILDEKINMFELVVGEIGAILGEMEEKQDFANMVFDAWIDATDHERPETFAALGENMIRAKGKYEAVKALDDELFGEEFETT
ncbi:MAG: SNF2-related protein, partial [Candidatus Bipolaricaulota bacterium]|nr:SNF2-related protein [Candidatus Bipolaricaulota bacterium]